MQIELIEKSTKIQYITVIIDDECNHAGADYEEVDFGYASYEKADWVDDWRLVLVCDKCESQYDDHFEQWEGK